MEKIIYPTDTSGTASSSLPSNEQPANIVNPVTPERSNEFPKVSEIGTQNNFFGTTNITIGQKSVSEKIVSWIISKIKIPWITKIWDEITR